jgi:hypothetical protein
MHPDLIKALIDASNAHVDLVRQASVAHMEMVSRLVGLAEDLVKHPTLAISPREQKVLDLFKPGVILTGPQIAKLLDLEYSGSFKKFLAAMVKRGLLQKNDPGFSRVFSEDYMVPDGP